MYTVSKIHTNSGVKVRSVKKSGYIEFTVQ